MGRGSRQSRTLNEEKEREHERRSRAADAARGATTPRERTFTTRSARWDGRVTGTGEAGTHARIASNHAGFETAPERIIFSAICKNGIARPAFVFDLNWLIASKLLSRKCFSSKIVIAPARGVRTRSTRDRMLLARAWGYDVASGFRRVFRPPSDDFSLRSLAWVESAS